MQLVLFPCPAVNAEPIHLLIFAFLLFAIKEKSLYSLLKKKIREKRETEINQCKCKRYLNIHLLKACKSEGGDREWEGVPECTSDKEERIKLLVDSCIGNLKSIGTIRIS